MDFIVQYLQANIVLVLFLVIGLGHLVGKLKIGSLALGPTTPTRIHALPKDNETLERLVTKLKH